ncbi:peptidase S41 [Helicobacter anseris]|uniref:Peptidase S41 n=1 Tax=Helicobacter anseris TaxID=375926 RepID=A0A3D8J689_9HELI|nr:peptidase S41 [Helicobacter anseris]
MKKIFLSGFLASGIAITFLLGVLYAQTDTSATKKSSQKERIEAYDKLTKIINTVENYYVDEIDIKEIIDKAIGGLLTNLDAHSDYLTEKKFKDLQAQTEGEFGGLGITIGMKDGALTIIAPLDDTPAQKAGLKSGDIILKINNESTLNMSIDDAVNLMRGKPKTSVELTIYRKNAPKPLDFKITRDIIQVKSVHTRKIENENFLYVRVNSFDKNVTSSVKNALDKAGKLDGIILDLRNNPGGLLNQAVGLSELFIKNGVIVSQKGKVKNENIEYKANGKAPYENLPIVVLINGGTASASEIVSGALQDYKRALIIGENSFGKGSVQVVLPLDSTSAIKLTTAKYYLPSGRTIQAIGVTPDIIVHPGAVPQSDGGFSLKEADLKNHLQNELDKISEDSKKDNKKEEKTTGDKKDMLSLNDINNDIQLKTAIDLLKSWNIIKPIEKSNKGAEK